MPFYTVYGSYQVDFVVEAFEADDALEALLEAQDAVATDPGLYGDETNVVVNVTDIEEMEEED